MLVVDLVCAHGHGFEGWFQSAEDLASQQCRGLVTCPMCGHAEVVRRPSATRYNRTGVGEPLSGTATPAAEAVHQNAVPNLEAKQVLDQLQAAYTQAVKQVLAATEDVGEQFPQEVRKIHSGQEAPRAIRGQASAQEAQALRDEGIDVVSLVVPEALKNTLQ